MIDTNIRVPAEAELKNYRSADFVSKSLKMCRIFLEATAYLRQTYATKKIVANHQVF